ncbi:hypothetical protein BDV10DRAFT_185274 [Aspergillus recurvatus]
MSFAIINGQIYTPGLAIIDAPQPYTPLGGDNLQIAIDVSGNGRLSLPADEDEDDDTQTEFHNITIFLTSIEKERNLTISNGTVPSDSDLGYVSPVLGLEPGSTVKHVNWVWPSCFVGSGSGDENQDEDEGDWRGEWNITLHQAFRWEGEEYYTVFELPISVTNGIEDDEARVACEGLENGFEEKSLGVDGGLVAGEPWVGEDGIDNGSEYEDGDGGNGAVGLSIGGGMRFWERVAWVALVVGMVL